MIVRVKGTSPSWTVPTLFGEVWVVAHDRLFWFQASLERDWLAEKGWRYEAATNAIYFFEKKHAIEFYLNFG